MLFNSGLSVSNKDYRPNNPTFLLVVYNRSHTAPVLNGRSAVPLSTILEPVSDLCRRQTSSVGQLSFASWARIRVV